MQKCENRFNFIKLMPHLILGACLVLPFSNIHAEGFNLKSESQQVSRKPINILGNWHISIIEIDGAFMRVPEHAEGASLQISNNQIAGIVGCNNFMAPYISSINPQQITISDAATTRKMCHPEEVMKFEDSFLRILNGTFMIEKNFEGISFVRDNIKIHLVR